MERRMDGSHVDEIVDIMETDAEEAKRQFEEQVLSMDTWQILKVLTDDQAVVDHITEYVDVQGYNCKVTDYGRGRWAIYVQITEVDLL